MKKIDKAMKFISRLYSNFLFKSTLLLLGFWCYPLQPYAH